MPCDVVDLGPVSKEALPGMPSVRVGPGCSPKQFCGHANLDARRSPRRLRGASFAAAGVAHVGRRSSLAARVRGQRRRGLGVWCADVHSKPSAGHCGGHGRWRRLPATAGAAFAAPASSLAC